MNKELDYTWVVDHFVLCDEFSTIFMFWLYMDFIWINKSHRTDYKWFFNK